MCTTVGREFADSEVNSKVLRTAVSNYADPCWRVSYADGGWEELTKREMGAGVGITARPLFST